jgi:hypothetical protein
MAYGDILNRGLQLATQRGQAGQQSSSPFGHALLSSIMQEWKTQRSNKAVQKYIMPLINGGQVPADADKPIDFFGSVVPNALQNLLSQLQQAQTQPPQEQAPTLSYQLMNQGKPASPGASLPSGGAGRPGAEQQPDIGSALGTLLGAK